MGKFFGIRPKTDEKRLAWRIAAIYAVAAGLWFLLLDQLLGDLSDEPERFTWIHLLNDWLYVLLTALLLGWLVRRQVRKLRREDERLREIAQGVSVAAGDTFFEALTRHLAGALAVESALVCELAGGELRTVAAHVRGEGRGDVECRMADTLCSKVVRQGRCHYAAGVREQFPDDRLLTQLEAESFLGIPLLDSAGRTLGLMAITDGKPLQDVEVAESILSVFAVRLAVELERRRAEEEVRRERDFCVSLLQGEPAYLVAVGPDGRIRTANDSLLRALGKSLAMIVNAEFLSTLVPPQERERMATHFRSLAGGPPLSRIESCLLTADGRLLPVAWRLRARLTAEGAIDYIVCLGTPLPGGVRGESAP